jgi:outer membrane biosynthesis protein TonB
LELSKQTQHFHPKEPQNLPENSRPAEGSQALSSSLSSDHQYRYRILVSIGISLLLNFFFLWLILSASFPRLAWLTEKPKSKITKEVPQLVLIKKVPLPEPPPRPKVFTETDKSQASPEKPKDAEHYSEYNTVATQTSPSITPKPTDVPKSEGENTKTKATESVLLTPPSQPLFPEPPIPEQPSKLPEREISPPTPPSPQKAADLPKSSDLAILKSAPPESKPAPQAEPRPSPKQPSVNTARGPPVPNSPREIPTAKSKLDGDVRQGRATAFNSAESPFASYDKKIIGKVGRYWQAQIENKFYGEKTGEVEISFKLLADGRIADLRITRNTSSIVLASWCLQAIQKSAPFESFPESMRVLVGGSRDASITFAY